MKQLTTKETIEKLQADIQKYAEGKLNREETEKLLEEAKGITKGFVWFGLDNIQNRAQKYADKTGDQSVYTKIMKRYQQLIKVDEWVNRIDTWVCPAEAIEFGTKKYNPAINKFNAYLSNQIRSNRWDYTLERLVESVNERLCDVQKQVERLGNVKVSKLMDQRSSDWNNLDKTNFKDVAEFDKSHSSFVRKLNQSI